MKSIKSIEKRLSATRRMYVEVLSFKMARIFHDIYGDNDYMDAYNEALYNLYKTALIPKKDDWKYTCEEFVLNLTR